MRIAVPIALLAIGCVTRSMSQLPPDQQTVLIKDVPLSADLDVLFVIDNSASTLDKQALFQSNFQHFVDVLDTYPGGRPNLHVGVVNTTVDIGAQGYGGCPSPDPADNGLLQPGSCNVSGRFITDVANATGGRTTNYSGELATAFTCMASVGDHGCGFEAPLEAMKRALDGSRPENAGFLRNGAPLVVVILTDEDDASVKDPSVFALPDAHQNGDFVLQPEFAYACDQPISATSPGTYTNCRVRTDSYLTDPHDYVDFLETVRDPYDFMVAVIASPPPGLATDDIPAQTANVNTEAVATGPLDLAAGAQSLALLPSTECTINGQAAVGRPALRLADFAGQLTNGRFYNVCQPDYSNALKQISFGIIEDFSPCLQDDVAVPLDCQVTDVQNRGTAAQTEELIPQCTPGGAEPCWQADQNTHACPSTPGNWELQVKRSSPPPDGTTTQIACAVAVP